MSTHPKQQQTDPPGSEAETAVKLEFTMTDPSYPFVGASAAEECVLDLEEFLPRGEGHYAEFFSVHGADVHQIMELAAQHDPSEARLLTEYDDGGLIEFVVWEDCPAVALAELGALPQRVTGDCGKGRIVADVPPHLDACKVIAQFCEQYPDVELTARRQQDQISPLLTQREFQQTLDKRLTDKQLAVLDSAFEAGYYEWPRETTGQELAETLDIAPATFSQHIRAAERKLLRLFFTAKPA